MLDLTTDAFLNALRYFVVLNGAVKQIRSDQGTHFVQLEKGTTEWDEHRVARFLTEKQCEFIMNVPKTSHIGNVRERQIRKVRNGMSTVLALAAGRLNDVTLRTFLCKSMAIVKSHTLTGDTIDKARSIEPLTPNHFVHMKISTPLPPPGKFLKEYFYATKRW